MTRTNLTRALWRILIVLFATACLQCSAPRVDHEPASANTGWRKLGPGGGGSTFMPVFSPDSPDRFVVRCDMTGTYITDDGGESYRQVNFPNGTSAYAYAPGNPQVIYIGGSELHKSTDGGVTWESMFPQADDIQETTYSGDHATYRLTTREGSLYPAGYTRISNIRVDPGDARQLYFSMGPYLFVSKDGGNKWQRLELDLPVTGLYVNTGSHVYVFTSHAVQKVDKASLVLSKISLPEAMTPAFSFSAGTMGDRDTVVIYALTNHADDDPDDEFGETSLWISTNEGKIWTRAADPTIVNPGLPPSYSMIACAENDAANAYLVANRYLEAKENGDTVYWYGALKTADTGTTWQWVWKGGGGSGRYGVKDGQGVANLQDAWAEEAFGGEYIRLLDAGVYAHDGNVAIVTDWYRTMKTTDGGQSWHEVYSMRQPDGSFISRGMDVTTAYGVHFDPFDENHIAISYTDIGYHHSFNNGKSWVRSVEGVPSEWVNTCYWMVFDPDIKGKIWSVWSNLHDFPRGKMTRNPRWKQYGKGGVCVSVDGGKTWKPSAPGMGGNSPSTSIVLDPNSPPGQRTLYASVFNKGVFKSTDDGKTWTLKNNGFDANTAAFELTLSPSGDLYVTVSPIPAHLEGKAGLDFYSGAVYKSTDGAETWTKLHVTDGLLFPNGIAVDPKNPEHIFLACWGDITLSDLIGGANLRRLGGENRTLEMPGGIFYSADGGATWTSVFDRNQYVYDVTIDPYQEGRLYCNTFSRGAWRSDDYGKTWKKLRGYDFHWGHRAIIDEHQQEKVYLTTYGSSVWHGTPVTEP